MYIVLYYSGAYNYLQEASTELVASALRNNHRGDPAYGKSITTAAQLTLTL